jgi:hypothetical protein
MLRVGQTMSIRSEKTENARNKLITSLIQDIAGQITFKDFEDFEKKMHLVL